MDAANAELTTNNAKLTTDLETEKKIPKQQKVIAKLPAEITKEQAQQVLKAELNDPDRFLGLLSGEIRGQMEYGRELYRNHRQGLVAQILDNAAEGVYTEAELKAMDEDSLNKLARAIPKKPENYSLLGAEGEHDSKVVPLLPAGVKEATG